MRITDKLMKQVVAEAIGEEALPIVDYIKNRKNISEFKVASALNLDINTVRQILYKLFDASLCTYNRKKDSKKGIYISYWTFNIKRIKYVLESMRNKKLEMLRERLEKELASNNNFYICPNFCVRYDFDRAAEHNFKCPECGALMVHQDNTKTIERIKQQIAELSNSK